MSAVPGRPWRDLRQARVLVAQPDPRARAWLAQVLEEVGLLAACAMTDADAYRLIPTLPTFAAVLVDADPGPAGGGFEIARFARRVIPQVAVVYLAGPGGEDACRALGAPNGDLLRKPFQAEALANILQARIAG